LRVFAKMRKIKLLPDMRTYELLFSLFGIANAPYEDSNMLSQVDTAKRINAIERDMANNGFQHSHLSRKMSLAKEVWMLRRRPIEGLNKKSSSDGGRLYKHE